MKIEKNISKKILDKLDEQSENQIGILGVTFKAETDDMREAPSLIIIPDLQDNGMNVSVYDPEGEEEASKLIENVNWKQTAYEAAEDVDCLVILTDWKEFKDLDLIKLKDKMKRPLIYDFRNIFDPDKMAELGFEYFSLAEDKMSEIQKVARKVLKDESEGIELLKDFFDDNFSLAVKKFLNKG